VKEFSSLLAYIYFKSGIVSEMLLDRDIVTRGHEQKVTYGLFNSSNCDDLGCTSRSFVDHRFLFKWDVSYL